MRRLIAIALVATCNITVAADYPNRPLRIIVPFTAGGSTDVLARMIGKNLTDAWGQQVVVDNRAGANGVIAAELIAKSNPDGHSLLMVAIGHAINPSLQKKLPYDTDKDFQPISLTAILPLLLAVHPSVKANNVRELITLAKSSSKPLNYASGGIGSSQHLAGELINTMAKIKMSHVPYKGGGPGLVDLLAGQVSVMASTAPAGLPPQVLSKLSAEVIKGTRAKEMQDALIKQGADPVGNEPKEFTAFIQSETAKYAKVIRDAGIKAE